MYKCPICHKNKVLERHHLLPKSLNAICDDVIEFESYSTKPKKFKVGHRVNDLVIKVCSKCHKKIHNEFLKYNDGNPRELD